MANTTTIPVYDFYAYGMYGINVTFIGYQTKLDYDNKHFVIRKYKAAK